MPPTTFLLWLALLWGLAPLAFPFARRLWADDRRGAADESDETPRRFLLPDGGWAVGRVLLLFGWTLAAFHAGHWGVPVRWSAFFLVPFAAFSAWKAWRERMILRDVLHRHRRGIIAGEALFFLVFAFFLMQRGFWPAFNDGEKPMDIALIGACARADSLPPPNPYLAGDRLGSYYYLGHLQTALLSDAIGAPARWTYNLMCATIPALAFSTLLTLGAALCAPLGGFRLKRGAGVTILVLMTGTLEPLRQWWERDPNLPAPWPFGTRPLDYFSTSRVIAQPMTADSGVNYTINEYPWFTFSYADLHAHFFAVPLVLSLLCLAATLWHGDFAMRTRWVTVAIAGLSLGALAITNSWDAPIYFLLLSLCVWPRRQREAFQSTAGAPESTAESVSPSSTAKERRAARRATAQNAPKSPHSNRKQRDASGGNFSRWLRDFVLLGALAFIAALPYLRRLHTNALGPAPLDQPASPLPGWLLFWGVSVSAWTWALLHRRFDSHENEAARPFRWRGAWLLGVPILAWILLRFGPAWQWQKPLSLPRLDGLVLTFSGQRDWSVLLILLTLLAATFWQAFASRDERHALLCRMAGCGFLVLLWSETTWAGFLSPSPIGATFHRQDTVFKFGLQAWYLIGLAASVALLRVRAPRVAINENEDAINVQLKSPWSRARSVVMASLGVLVIISWSAIWATARERAKAWTEWKGLDSWSHMAPPERAAAAWLQSRARDGDTLLEAEQQEGGDYTEYSRYAHATGIPTFIGPKSHTYQWGWGKRPDTEVWPEIERRKTIARAFFSARRPPDAAASLAAVGVKWIVIGQLEREQYGESEIAQTSRSLSAIVSFGAPDDKNRVTIYRLPEAL